MSSETSVKPYGESDGTKSSNEQHQSEPQQLLEFTANNTLLAWQGAVTDHLSDFAAITTLVVQPETKDFLANQKKAIKRMITSKIKGEYA